MMASYKMKISYLHLVVVSLSGNASAFQESFRKLSALWLGGGAVHHLLEYVKPIVHTESLPETDQKKTESVPETEQKSFRKSSVFEFAAPHSRWGGGRSITY